jgi:hypothetical protein
MGQIPCGIKIIHRYVMQLLFLFIILLTTCR